MSNHAETDVLTAFPKRDEIERTLPILAGDAIQLVAIPAEGGGPLCQWFGGNTAGAVEWAAKRNAERYNIYWSVNEVRPGLSKKAQKSDIVGVRYAHVDIDPPKDCTRFNKQAKLLDLELLVPSPSITIDSGGGLQAFWRLEGNASQDEVERVNIAIASRLGGDNCHNIDRIMRVPGTVNWPNAKKRALGRLPVTARLVEASSVAYTVAQLAEAFPASAETNREENRRGNTRDQPNSREGAKRAPSGLSGYDLLARRGIAPNSTLYQLTTDPDCTDRSNDVFATACEMVRQGYSDDGIMDVLLDAELPIGAHCRDQPDPERAARRAITRARKVAASGPDFPALPAGGPISATPYEWPDPQGIPRRRWLYGRQLLRGSLSLIVAPGGMGKTALTVGMALALATGRPLLGKDMPDGPQRVWLWNLEDAREELDRSIAAASIRHRVTPADVAGRLFVDSGLDGAELRTAIQDRQGVTICQPIYDALLNEIGRCGIDVLIVDPFVSSHSVPENDNGAIDAVAKAWARIAAAADCAIILVHHTSKSAGIEITAERSRGAVALVNAARSVVALNRMTEGEAKLFGVCEADRRRCFRVYDDKSNRAPPAEASDWYRLESVPLPNGEGDDCFGDNLGVVAPWTPPQVAAETLDPEQVLELQQAIAENQWREDQRADLWAGKAVAQVFGLNAADPVDKPRIKSILKECLRAGWLTTARHHDASRRERSWIETGKPVERSSEFSTDAPEDGVLQCPSSAPVYSVAVQRKVLRSSSSPLGGTGSGAERSIGAVTIA